MKQNAIHIDSKNEESRFFSILFFTLKSVAMLAPSSYHIPFAILHIYIIHHISPVKGLLLAENNAFINDKLQRENE